MKKKLSIILAVAAAALCLTACQGEESGSNRSDEDGQISASDADSEGGLSDDKLLNAHQQQQEDALYNYYIDINNHILGPLNEALGRYFDYVDYESAQFQLLNEDRDYYYTYYPSSCLTEADAAYELAYNKKEKNSLDEAYLNMYPSLFNVMNIMRDISDYASDELYIEDNFAKSQQHHTTLMESLGEYLNTADVFLAEVSDVATKRQMEDLENMKESGALALYAINMAIYKADEIIEELYAEEVWDDNVLDMDLEAIQPLYEEFCSYVDEVSTYNEDKDKLKEEGLYNSVDGMRCWGFFYSALEKTHKSITDVLAKVESGEGLSDFVNLKYPYAGDCSLSGFQKGLEETIDAYNNLF